MRNEILTIRKRRCEKTMGDWYEARPRLLLSRCFFEYTRYDGNTISNDLVKRLSKCCDVVRVCPELEIGLGVPREPIDVFSMGNELKLMNKTSKIDLTEKMVTFSKDFAKSLSQDEIDGMILKAKSPSCGLRDARLYGSNGKVVSKTYGFFAREMVESFPDLPIESEMRLNDSRIRFDFLSSIFAIARFRNVVSKSELIEFQRRYKFFILAKNERTMREMGKLAAQKGFTQEMKHDYMRLLMKALKTPMKKTSVINTLLHIYGFFKDLLTSGEKAYFMDLLDGYKNGLVTLQVMNAVLKSWAISHKVAYIKDQVFFEPYPGELEPIEDM